MSVEPRDLGFLVSAATSSSDAEVSSGGSPAQILPMPHRDIAQGRPSPNAARASACLAGERHESPRCQLIVQALWHSTYERVPLPARSCKEFAQHAKRRRFVMAWLAKGPRWSWTRMKQHANIVPRARGLGRPHVVEHSTRVRILQHRAVQSGWAAASAARRHGDLTSQSLPRPW